VQTPIWELLAPEGPSWVARGASPWTRGVQASGSPGGATSVLGLPTADPKNIEHLLMKPKRFRFACLTFHGLRALRLSALCLALTGGCSEPAAEAPKDIEQARQEHINTTQRELEHSSSQP
jgi:hypothetical protein